MAIKKKKSDKPETDWQTLHIPMRRELISQVDVLAVSENRTRVNMIAELVRRSIGTPAQGVAAQ
jgi:hypothetical protein